MKRRSLRPLRTPREGGVTKSGDMAVATARWLVLLLAVSVAWASAAAHEKWRLSGGVGGQVVEKERRRVVAASEAGTVTAVDVADEAGTAYRLQFITMDPGALFLPVQLHADMVFYVHSGRGKVIYIEEGNSETGSLVVERGDVYNFEQGTVLYIQSYPCATSERLRIYAIFTSDGINADDPSNPKSEAYSSVSDLLKGFEVEVLRLGFGASREVVEAIKSAQSPPSIIPYNPEDEDEESNWKEDIFDALWGVRDPHFLNKKKKKDKHKDKHKHKKDKKYKTNTFNFFSGKPDVENCYGWSRSMTNEDLQSLQGSNIGMFMVNLTTGAMMGPHWNPKATEIAIVTDGEGIVQTVCPSSPSGESKRKRGHHEGGGGGPGGDHGEGIRCRNSVFRVKEGDVFVVPRFHPMAQISFNNDSFSFVGFSTEMGRNHPQFLAGSRSVLQVIGKEILALSLGQNNSTAVERLLSAQRDSTILACTSCAEELEKKAEQEEWRRRKEEEEEGGKGKGEQEEEERRREEEWKRREEEKARKEQEQQERRREEEEQRKREEEERARREQEQEERRREEEWKRREEEKARKEQEQQERKREEEEQRKREEEERARREQEEEERRRREKEEEEEGGGGESKMRGEEGEEGEWGEPQYRSSNDLKKRYHVRKGGVFKSA